jgi:predicted DNA-binding protein (MmcQ/YjbR family)
VGANVTPVAPAKPIDRIREVCLSLPEAEERPFGGHTAPAFRVRDKFFVMTSEDGLSITLKAASGIPAILVGDDPARFFVPPYVGSKGWLGIRVDADVDWEEVADLIRSSYCLIAPKRLARHVAAPT